MRCKNFEDLLPGYIEDVLITEERARVSAHLDRCPACAGLLDRLKRTGAALSEISDVEPGPALMANLRDIPSTSAPRRRFPVLAVKPALQPVLAGAFLVLTFTAVLVFTPAGGRLIKTLNRQVHAGYDTISRVYAKAESVADSLDGAREKFIVSLEILPPLGRNQE